MSYEMSYNVILDKVLELAKVYADPAKGKDSAEAKEIRDSLAVQKAADVKKALLSAKRRVTTAELRDKILPTVNSDLLAALTANETDKVQTTPSAAPKPADKVDTMAPDTPQTPEVKTADSDEKKTPQTTPADKDNQADNKKNSKPDREKKSANRQLPDEVVADLNKYIYGKDGAYSPALEDYIKAEKSAPREKVSHALNIIDYMWNEFQKPYDKTVPNAPRIYREKLVNLALTLNDLHQGADGAAVAKKAGKFLAFMSRKSANYYLRKGQDSFMDNLREAGRRASADSPAAAFIDEVAVKHVAEVLKRLETDEAKLKYAQFLQKKKFIKYIPQELQDKLAEINAQRKDKPKSQTKGDEPMTDEVKTETDDKETATPKTAEETTAKREFVLTKAQAWVAAQLDLKQEDFATVEDMIAKINSSDYVIDGDKVFIKDGSDKKRLVAEYNKDKDTMVEVTTIGTLPKEKTEENKENLPQPIEAKPWVLKKIEDYRAMETAGKIGKFEPNMEIKDHFEAKVDGVTVKYSSPDNVQVSENADIKTFEIILNEPDNKNRTINFAEGMPHETSMLLKAACMLNGRAMTGALPEFSEGDLEKLAASLGAERYAALQEAISKANGENQPKTEEAPEKGNTEETESKSADEAKRVIGSAEDLNKDAERLREIRQKFEGMKAYGWIAMAEGEDGKPKIVPGRQFEDPQSDEAKTMVASANKLFTEAAEIVMSNKTFAAGLKKDDKGKFESELSDQQKADNATFNAERMEYIRSHMSKESLEKHEAKADQVALIHAKRMGLIDEKVTRTVKEGDKFVEKEVETLKDDALKEYKSAHYADGSAMKARIDKVLKDRKQSEK